MINPKSAEKYKKHLKDIENEEEKQERKSAEYKVQVEMFRAGICPKCSSEKILEKGFPDLLFFSVLSWFSRERYYCVDCGFSLKVYEEKMDDYY